MAAASPRVSGFTSVIQLSRWYRSQGSSTLRRTCFSMRKSCEEKRKYFSGNHLFCLFKVLHSPVLRLSISHNRWREELDFTVQSPR